MNAVLPTALVLKVREVRATVLVDVRCPVCGRRHQHGWPLGTADVGLRVSHCHRPNGEPVRSYDVRLNAAGGVL